MPERVLIVAFLFCLSLTIHSSSGVSAIGGGEGPSTEAPVDARGTYPGAGSHLLLSHWGSIGVSWVYPVIGLSTIVVGFNQALVTTIFMNKVSILDHGLGGRYGVIMGRRSLSFDFKKRS